MSHHCSGKGCENLAKMQCPQCKAKNLPPVYFCSQDCFKKNWAFHKLLHLAVAFTGAPGSHDPFRNFKYTGNLRAAYPLSPTRELPAHIVRPDYHQTGRPLSEIRASKTKITVNAQDIIERMRRTCRLAREVLDIACQAVRPGMLTDDIDKIVHEACIARDCYPSPLNYYNFPKSVCTSVNEVICHGIPDQTVLQLGDIINIDVTCYFAGVHGDLNETVFVIDEARKASLLSDPEFIKKQKLVEATHASLEKAIAHCGPGKMYREIGAIIEAEVVPHGFSVVRSYCGHGIGELFHSTPNVPHYKGNKASGTMQPGHIFTIEPMINMGKWQDETWPDNWTAVTTDGKPSAQFEHTLLITDTGVEVLTAWLDGVPNFKKQLA